MFSLSFPGVGLPREVGGHCARQMAIQLTVRRNSRFCNSRYSAVCVRPLICSPIHKQAVPCVATGLLLNQRRNQGLDSLALRFGSDPAVCQSELGLGTVLRSVCWARNQGRGSDPTHVSGRGDRAIAERLQPRLTHLDPLDPALWG